LERLALGVVIDTGQAYERGVSGTRGRYRFLHEVAALSDMDELAG
jgi:hypothetical protein